MKEQLKRTAQALEADAAAPATADADGGGGGGAQQQKGLAGKAQQRAKKADDYHARHAQWVAEFNELTGGECAGGEGGVKWAAVRAWQQKHWQANNLLADGLIGPKTIEAAKIVAKKNGAKDDKKDGKDGGDGGAGKEKQHEAPQPGQAEGAEASIEKPKLDDESDEEQAPAAADGENKGPAKGGDGKKAPTLVEFEQVVAKLEAALAAFKQPQGGGAKKPIAQHYVEGTDDKEAKPATGAMMAPKALGDYKAAAKALHGRWDDLDAAGRANALLEAVNHAIAAEQVPPIHRVDLIDMPNPGEFVANLWIMHMSDNIFSTLRSPGTAQVDDIASKVFHEGRHAEQRFSIARLVASDPHTRSVDDVIAKSGVDEVAAKKAFAMRSTPLPAQQAQAAERFQHATRDKPEEHEAIEHASAEITDAANHVAATFRAMSPGDQAIASARWQDLRQRTIVALEAYYQLDTERDAYAAQKQLGEAPAAK